MKVGAQVKGRNFALCRLRIDAILVASEPVRYDIVVIIKCHFFGL